MTLETAPPSNPLGSNTNAIAAINPLSTDLFSVSYNPCLARIVYAHYLSGSFLICFINR